MASFPFVSLSFHPLSHPLLTTTLFFFSFKQLLKSLHCGKGSPPTNKERGKQDSKPGRPGRRQVEHTWENSTQQAQIWRQVFPLHKFTLTCHTYIPPGSPVGHTVLAIGQNGAAHAERHICLSSFGGWHPSQSRTYRIRLLKLGFQAGGNFQLTSLC